MKNDSRNFSRSSNRFVKLKRKPRGSSRKHSNAINGRSPKFQAVPLIQLNADHPAEPNDIPFRGLLSCNSATEVDNLHAKWWGLFNVKARKALRAGVVAEDRTVVEALLTQPGATSRPMQTSESVCREAFHVVRDGLVAASAANPGLEMGLVTFISGDGGTSHFHTEIDLCGSRKKVLAALRAMARNFFGVTELALFNSQGHPNGGQMVQRHEHALIWGPDGTLQKAQSVAAKHAERFTPNFSGAPIIDVKLVACDPVNLARITAYLFKPPYKCMNWNPGKDGKPGRMNGSEKGDRAIRYLRLAMIRTMMPFEDACFGSGEGQRLRSAMIKFVRALATREAANGRAVLHPDAVASFWVKLMPQIKADRWNLPIIKTSE